MEVRNCIKRKINSKLKRMLFPGGYITFRNDSIECPEYHFISPTIKETPECFLIYSLQDFSKPWTDEKLYKKYKLTDDEIQFIESIIKPME